MLKGVYIISSVIFWRLGMVNAGKNILKSTVVFAFGVLCFATSSLAGNCFSGPGAASGSQMDAFNATPASILAGNPSDTLLTSSVRDLAATETNVTAMLLTLAVEPATTDVQRAAIGAGLGRAVNVCRPQHSDLADEISAAVAAAILSNPALGSFRTAFEASLIGQTTVAALGGASPAGGGDIGGPGASGLGGPADSADGGGATQGAGSLQTSASGGGNFTIVRTSSVSGSI
ncbi:hypothetical protein [Rhizobium leguminosarum]|uniref:hypothetical protein n=1 Tax=Rhizobium leguminosarum TaxID=384 RepID=UPI0024B3A6C8|nr:hypothetical protein [Rhizobium leguminosarum]WHO84305.1 hypothetical protein QMO81_007258 [Rhizobium leguminosarum]